MDIELLRTFLEVRNTRHFGKAANNLFITQAAVSSRVKLLEQMLGTPLFVRYRNNLQLTDTGERLVTHAEDIIMAWERAKHDLSIRKTHKKVIRFGATTGFCAVILQNNLGTIYSSVKDVVLRAESLDEETLISRLRDRRLDLALLFDSSKNVDFLSVPVSSAELILVSTNKDDTIETALNNDHVAVEWGAFFSIKYQKMFPDAASPVLQTSLSRIALQFILENTGSAFLPYGMVKEHLNRDLYQVPGAPVIQQPIYAIYHESCPYIEEILKIIAVIKESSKRDTMMTDDLEEQSGLREKTA